MISVPWQLLCGHWYHLKCLQDLKKNGKHALIRDRCPTCRQDSHNYALPPPPSCKGKYNDKERRELRREEGWLGCGGVGRPSGLGGSLNSYQFINTWEIYKTMFYLLLDKKVVFF